MPWTRERLEEVARERLAGARLIVVANREPYQHYFGDDGVQCRRPAGGLTAALDPVMRTCGGVWVAHGSGEADREAVDEHDRVRVPPGDEEYTLRRVWLSKAEEQGYYYGLSNDALWPLCHIAYMRPHFDSHDWEQYRRVNQKFADAVLEEIGSEPAMVFVQDYHFTLLPRLLKNVRDDLVIAQFWHIPWPNREAFRICPWQNEIVDGLLGNDLLSFHVQYHCNNFLDTVDRTLESRVDRDRFTVTYGGKTTLVRPHPISIDPSAAESFKPAVLEAAERRLRQRLRLRDERLLVGIDRADYTKGIPERMRAVDRLLDLHPELKGTFRLVQVAAPSRTHIPAYRQLQDELDQLADQINWRHEHNGWRPIVLFNEHFSAEQVYVLNRLAAVCVVSSLHDGMNLVAKEFVASRDDSRGVLVLSRFTGASAELSDALQINPFAIDEFSDALYRALTMPADEQEARMRRMRQQVLEHNVYRWAGHLLGDIVKLADSQAVVGESA
ncbi:MAG: alpha,alpha-trehalose-phosphate synthase (UDP-forming) [Planctomycetaceae bacterium]